MKAAPISHVDCFKFSICALTHTSYMTCGKSSRLPALSKTRLRSCSGRQESRSNISGSHQLALCKHEVCLEHGIEHRLTKVKHPWTNGQVERMNRTIKGATVGRYHYGSHDELKKHLHAFLMAYNLASRLKSLKEKSPYDFIRAICVTDPESFIIDLNHFAIGLNT